MNSDNRKKYIVTLWSEKRGDARSFVMAYNETEARVIARRMYPHWEIREAILDEYFGGKYRDKNGEFENDI